MKHRAPTRAKRAQRTSRAESARRPAAPSQRRARTRGASGSSGRSGRSGGSGGSGRSNRSGRAGGSGRASRSSRSTVAPQALRLPAECTLAGAESLKLRLSELVQNVQAVTLDTAEVRRIDTATLQLLAAFARDRRNGALELRIAGESAVFEESARLLGLADLLGRPSA